MSAVLYFKMQKVGKTNIKGKKKNSGKDGTSSTILIVAYHINMDNQTVGQTK